MLKKILNLFGKKELPPEFTQEEIARGYAVRMKRIVGELIHGYLTVVIQHITLTGGEVKRKEKHCCLPIPDSLRPEFNSVLRGVPSFSEKDVVWNYVLNHEEVHRG